MKQEQLDHKLLEEGDPADLVNCTTLVSSTSIELWLKTLKERHCKSP